MMVYSGVSRRSRAWFSSVGGQGGLRYGDQNWIYRDTSGPAVAVGNLNTNAPFWGSAAPVGGLQISNWTGSGAALPEGRFGYSSSVYGSTAWTPAPVPAPSTTAPRWAAARYATA
ncbi:hypothetical protein WJ968_31035 [Achromobacter xylosoxidans]